jgi:hypothetical protein
MALGSGQPRRTAEGRLRQLAMISKAAFYSRGSVFSTWGLADAGRVQEHEQPGQTKTLEEIVIDEAYFLKSAMLQIGQGLRDDLVVGEFIHGDVHFRLR